MPAPAVTPRPRWRRLLVVLAASAWVGTGLAAPALATLLQPERVAGDTLALMVVLLVFAIAGSNVELRFSRSTDGPVWSPVGVPIVIAVVACTPEQAMLVASLGYLLDRATWRRGRRLALETAGLGAMSTGIASLVAGALGASFASPGSTLVAAVLGSVLFLTTDAASYAVWYHVESRSGGDVLRCFVGAAPIDVTFTAIAVIIAGPFVATPGVLALVLAGCQLAILALYRLVTSEARHREQSSYLRDVFARYVPESVADRLADGHDDVHLGGELRDVSVLFCDIRGFTTWAQHRSAEEVVRELNDVLGRLAAVVLDGLGTLDKFTGDGLMAFWGAPLDQPDHARRACRAALEMQRVLDERRGGSDGSFRIGIGVASGQVVVGNVGHEQRLDYTAIGDVVNLAARLEQATKDLGVDTVIADATLRLLPASMRTAWQEVGSVPVRGRSGCVRVHAPRRQPPTEASVDSTLASSTAWMHHGSEACGLPVRP